ncbi:60S ribosomal protein L21 [Microtus ochrogaster]|uniref:60S ribosomal protein L21 n=1 Tax=Microtus ochrogaster TaxID=79684 RepID=A0A8J6GWT1_MICOH|nr:60S ribosomal protein L21 [Microtus ochrogaster]
MLGGIGSEADATPLLSRADVMKQATSKDFTSALYNKSLHEAAHLLMFLAQKYFNHQHAVGIIVNKQVKGKILAKRINVRIEHIKHSKSRDSFLKGMKENDQKKKEAKEKGTWVQLKRQPAPPREAHFVRTTRKEPELLEPIPFEFVA